MLRLLIGYMFLYIHRPFEVWPALGTIRLELLYMIVVAIAWAGTKKRMVSNPLVGTYSAFVVATLFCILASPWCEHCLEVHEGFFKMLVFCIFVITAIHDEEKLKTLTVGFLIVFTIYMLHSLVEFGLGRHVYRMKVARMVGVDATHGDPNAFAASLLMALAFVPAAWKLPGRRLKWFLGGFTALAGVCVALTGSRSGFVGVLIWAAAVIGRSRWRVPLAIAAIAGSPLAWAALPEQYRTRFETIIDPSVGPKNAQASVQGRLDGLRIGFELWQANPLTGIGPGAWRPATGRELESHNLYGQVVGEMGTLGALTFLSVLAAFAVNFWSIRKAYRENPHWGQDFLYEFNYAIALTIFLLLFEGNFGHNLFRYCWAWFGAFLVVARHCVEERRQRELTMNWDEPEAPFHRGVQPEWAGSGTGGWHG
jgi:O-antigen ligase